MAITTTQMFGSWVAARERSTSLGDVPKTLAAPLDSWSQYIIYSNVLDGGRAVCQDDHRGQLRARRVARHVKVQRGNAMILCVMLLCGDVHANPGPMVLQHSPQLNTFTATPVTSMLQVPPKETHITIKPSASVSVGTTVTLTCRSKASPSGEMNYTWYKRGQEMSIAQGKQISLIVTHNNTGSYFCIAQNKHGNQSSAEIQLTVEGQDGHFMPMIVGCVGGIVAVLMLSALGFCARTRTKTHRGDIVGDKDSLHQAQDETIDRNSTYDDVHTVTTQDNKISDDYSLCEFTTQTDHNTGKDQTEEDNYEKGSDVVYAQVHMIHKKPKATSVVPENIYSQVKT